MVCEEGKLAKDFETKAQLKKAALSTMNNIAEGFGRFNTPDTIFYGFLTFSQSSAIEVQSMLVRARGHGLSRFRRKFSCNKADGLRIHESTHTRTNHCLLSDKALTVKTEPQHFNTPTTSRHESLRPHQKRQRKNPLHHRDPAAVEGR
jgi:four helix bundle protein